VHTVVGTAANVGDVTQTAQVLHGEEKTVYLDAGYTGVEKREELKDREIDWQVAMKRGKLKAMPEDSVLGQLLRKLESVKASIRSKVEHPFHIVKNLFHFRKVRYKGLAKNTAQLHTLFGLANLMIAKRILLTPLDSTRGLAMRNHVLVLALITAFGAGLSSVATAGEMVDVYKNPNCDCCGKWIDHLKDAGFEVRAHNVMDVPATRKRLGMPDRLGSCHTAKVAGYVVEGHVPAGDIQRLLKEKPKALGIAVPSMPPGSPGMESSKPVPYNTLLVQSGGEASIFAKH
jgi:hypothetical protein